MALTDVVLVAPDRGPRCTVCAVFEGVADTEWQQVATWRGQGHTWISIAAAVTREYGSSIRAHSLSRHARGDCIRGPR